MAVLLSFFRLTRFTGKKRGLFNGINHVNANRRAIKKGRLKAAQQKCHLNKEIKKKTMGWTLFIRKPKKTPSSLDITSTPLTPLYTTFSRKYEPARY